MRALWKWDVQGAELHAIFVIIILCTAHA